MTILLSQEQEPKKRGRKDTIPVRKIVVDTVTVAERFPESDRILLEQKVTMNKLDSLLMEVKKK